MPTSTDYNFEQMTSTLRTVLNQHSIGNAEEICQDYERQLIQQWQAQGIQPAQVNEVFKQGQTRGARGGNQ